MIRVVDMRLAGADRKPQYRWFKRMVFDDYSPAPSWSGYFWYYWIVVTLPKIGKGTNA
jgi:hypothetical protein